MKAKRSVFAFSAAVLLGVCVFASCGATGSETPGWTPTYPAGFDEQHTIATFGDSITAGSESHGDTCRAANFDGGSLLGKNVVLTYTYWLARMVPSNFNVFGTARPEMVTDSILGWQGSVDLRLVDSVTLPKGGGTVACKVWFWDEATQTLKSSLNNKRNKGLEVPSSISGWVDGHHVTYVRDGKMMLYAKGTEDVTLPAGAKFVPDFHYMYADSIQILFAGHNDGESSWEYNLAMLKKAVATIPSGRFIVVTSPCFTRPERKAAFIEAFGADRYLDCYELLNTSGIQQAIDLGLLKKSELDRLTLKDGVYMLTDDLYYPGKPYPAWHVLLTGGTNSKPGPHMNALGHFLVARALHAKLLKNGWIATAKHTAHAFPALSDANSVSPPSATEKVSYPRSCGDGIALRFCTAEGCPATAAEPSHGMYPGGHAWVETSDECCNWLCDAKKSDVGHDHVYGAWTTNAAPTCVKTGARSQTCTVDGCGETKRETLPAFGHDFRETGRTATAVNYACSRCGETKTEPIGHTVHTYGPWTTNVPPTCVEAGERMRGCTFDGCSQAEREAVPATGHVWIETQRQQGEIHYECANCPEVYMDFYDETAEWGRSNRVTVAGVDYCVLAFTNTAVTGWSWTVPAGVTNLDFLVVGGGGGGGGSAATSYYGGGGGGAGGVVSGTLAATTGDRFTVFVGAGGAGGAKGTGNRGESGRASALKEGAREVAVAPGGGGGGASSKNVSGLAGACGGGGGVSKGAGGAGGSGGAGGAATDLAKMTRAGGGGGAGGPGAAGQGDGSGGDGGAGADSAITGVSATYARGGKGGGWLEKTTVFVAAKGGADGTGDGGDGANDYYQCPCSAQADGLGGRGGDGIVIVRYAAPGVTERLAPGEESAPYPDEAAAKAAAERTVVAVPAEVAERLDASRQALYVACFEIRTRRNGDGRWVNEVAMTRAAEEALQEQVDSGVTNVLPSLSRGTLTLSPVTPGFYYALEYGETLLSMGPLQAALATDANGLTLPIPKRSTSGFYRVTAGGRQ